MLTFPRTLVDFPKSVQIKLALEALVFAHVEIAWQDVRFKPRQIKDLEYRSTGYPGNYIVETFVFCILKQFEELKGKTELF